MPKKEQDLDLTEKAKNDAANANSIPALRDSVVELSTSVQRLEAQVARLELRTN